MDKIELLIQMIKNGNLGSNVVSNTFMKTYLEFICSDEQPEIKTYGQPYISYYDVDAFNSLIESFDADGLESIINKAKKGELILFINNIKLTATHNEYDATEIKDVIGTKYFNLEPDTETGSTKVITFEDCHKSLKFEVVEFPNHSM